MFSFESIKDFSNCCRTCLNSTAEMRELFSYRLDVSIADILSICTNIKVNRQDVLPKKLCSTCFDCLVNFYDLRKQAEKIDQDLRTHIQSTNLGDLMKLESEIETSQYVLDIEYDEDAEYKNEFDLLDLDTDPNFACENSNDNFISQAEVKENTSKQKNMNVTKYICELCKKVFKEMDKFDMHVLSHEKGICLETCEPENNKSDQIRKSTIGTEKIKLENDDSEYSKENAITVSKLQNDNIEHCKENGQDKTNSCPKTAKNDENLIFECDICSATFKSIYSLSAHIKRHMHDGRVLNCKVCKKVFKKIGNLKRHELTHDARCHLKNDDSEPSMDDNIEHCINNELENTNACSKNFESGKNLIFKCDVCSVKYKSVHSLHAHMKKHTPKNRVLTCGTCNKVFKRIHHLKRHELTHSKCALYRCSNCPKTFTDEPLLKQHVSENLCVKQHKCPSCKKLFSTLSSLEKHSKIHEKEKRTYICAYCGKIFNGSGNLKQHTKRHLGVRNYSCTYCPRTFFSYGEHASHTLTHTGVRQHSCDQCGSTFTKRTSLTKHKQQLHLGIRRHQCDVCPMRFSTKDQLTRHYRTHTGEKPYQCELCSRAFTQSNDLVKHRRQHLGDNLYKCEECSESFRLKTELQKHLSEHYISRKGLADGKNDTSTANNKNSEQTKDKDVDVDIIDNGSNTFKKSKAKDLNKIAKNLMENTVQSNK